ncbi:MAG: response regulator [Gammaproteobacteria bacterium]|nr:response regulator [Gammaproteobacteria bacterium]
MSFLEPIQFIFSPAILFLGACILPFRWSFALTIMVLGHFGWYWQSADNATLYFLQWIAYQYGLKRNWNPISTDLLYWFLVGIPLAALSALYVYQEWLGSVSLTILLKLPVNGLMCVLMVNLVISLPLFSKLLTRKLSLQNFIKDILLAVLFLPLLVVFFLTKLSLDKKNIENVEQTNQSFALLTKNRIDAFLTGYETHVKTLSEMLSGQDWEALPETQRLLSSVHKINHGFITMLIADTNGKIQFSSPPELVSTGTNVKDRNYFQYPEVMMLSYISDVFKGRGFGVDPIVAISAPIANGKGEFDGIVEGSLNLYKFDFLLFMPEEIPTEVLIMDNSEKVIFSSKGLALDFLQAITLRSEFDEIYGDTLYINDLPTEYTYGFETSANGWSIIFLNERSFHFQKLGESYVRLLIFTLAFTFLLYFISQVLSKKINRPIRKLLNRYSAMAKLKDDIEFESEKSNFYEIRVLFEQFDNAYGNMVKNYHEQQRTFAEKVSAEEKSKAKSELLSKVSHELRTPLNAILGQTQLLLLEKKSKEERERLEKIERAGKFLAFLIDDLLLMSKSELKALKVHCEPVDLMKVIESSLDLLKKIIENKSINLTLNLESIKDILVLGNELRLQQVITNLISNAVKYNHKKGRVEISATVEDHRVILSVTDNGFGIPEEYQDNVFQPFNRLSQEHGDIEGSGIGLALAKQLLSAMNATIDFQSRENEGTKFTIHLPMSEPLSQTKALFDSKCPLDLSQKRILYVEDNQTNYLILSAWMKKKGCQNLEHAPTGEEGHELCKSHQYDLILLDLGLPDISGLELFDCIKKEQQKAVIVALTADISEASRNSAISKGFDAFLTKPVIFDDVESTLSKLLNNPDEQN